MAKLNDNYYLRQHYLKTDQVPTQSVMKNKMSLSLAGVYFKTMTPKQKFYAGFEPRMKGGGCDWYVPPKELLKGRSVLKPEKKENLSKLNYIGVDDIGMQLYGMELIRRQREKNYLLYRSDKKWDKYVGKRLPELHEKYSNTFQDQNSEDIDNTFNQFKGLYSISITKFEEMFSEVAAQAAKRQKDYFHQQMTHKYQILLRLQRQHMHEMYEKRLTDEKNRLKNKFEHDLGTCRTEISENIHDIKIEKQLIIGTLRRYLEYQKLACQIYVALKEREECQKEIEQTKHKYRKTLKAFNEEIALLDHEISLCKEKQKKRQEFDNMWTKKVKRLVKHFQRFVTYCVRLLPEHAKFFMDMEKLTLSQFSEVLENPSADSLFQSRGKDESTEQTGPMPQPNPFYLLCDKKHRNMIDPDLCPIQGSSATKLPVIVINKRCIYAACDSFEQYSEKLAQFIHGKRDDELHLEDHHIYEHDVPVKYTSSQHLLELKLEGSLFQILQQELSNLQLTQCPVCKMSRCFCGILSQSDSTYNQPQPPPSQSQHRDQLVTAELKMQEHKIASHQNELKHEREPKWERYSKYKENKTCICSKSVKKDLMENLPPYMRQMSIYEAPELRNYEMCSILTIKDLVKKAIKTTSDTSKSVPVTTEDAATQYEDEEFEALCNCFTIESEDSYKIAKDDESDLSSNIITSMLNYD